MFKFGLLSKARGLPRTGLLLYLKSPNGTGGDTGKYVLAAGNASLFAAVGAGFWYTNVDAPVARTAAEIEAQYGINLFNVLFNGTKLAIYSRTTDHTTLNKARRYLKETQLPHWLPPDCILHYDADLEPFAELTGGVHTYNSSILAPQYQLNADGTYTLTPHNLLTNSVFAGAASGTPGTVPTGWTAILTTNGTIALSGESITYTAAAGRILHGQTMTLLANTQYSLCADITFDGSLALNEAYGFASPPSGATTSYFLNGAGVVGTTVPTAGLHRVCKVLTVGGTAGTVVARIGVGHTGTSTGTVTVRNPLFRFGRELAQEAYVPTTTAGPVRVPAVDTFGGQKWLRSCGAVTNLIPNSECVGAAVGVAPTGWTAHGATTNGVVRTVVGAGPGYIDYRIAGTATANSGSTILPQGATQSAVSGQTWTAYYTVEIITGTVPAGGTLSLALAEFSSGLAFIAGSFTPITSGTNTIAGRTLNQATCANVRAYIDVYVPNGQSVDLTIRISRPQLTQTAYPLPYVPTTGSTVTQPASNATTTNGSWFALPDGSELWQALTGSPLTLATRVRMGVGSGDLPNSTSASLFAPSINTGPLDFRKSEGGFTWFQCWDGSGTAQSPSSVFQRGQVVLVVCQTNTAGSQVRIGHFVEGTHTAIQWGSWTNYDGSFNPSTLYRLMLGFNHAYPLWFNKTTAWRRQISDAEILEALS